VSWRTGGITIAIALAVAGSLWYVTAPPKGDDGYRQRAASALETIHAQIQSARIWVETFEDAQATAAATQVGLEEAERDASETASDFERHEPPTGALELRSQFSSATDRAVAELGALRVASEQERWEDLGRLAEPLARRAAEIERLERAARP
jgi:hypothetical protein